MKKIKSLTIGCSLIIVICVASAFVLFLIRRNSPPSKDDLLTECQIPLSNITIRLYEPRGSSATTSDSSIITYQELGAREIIIFNAYSSPAIKDLICEQNQIALIRYADDKPSIFLPLSWIQNQLIHNPLTFYKLKLTSLEYKNDVSGWEGIDVP